MAYGTTRVNGFDQFTAGTLRSVAQLKAIKISLQDASNTAIDCSALDDGSNELVELIVREVQPLMYELAGDGSTGIIHCIVDGHAVDADSLTSRVKNIVIGYGSYGTAATNDTAVTVGTHVVVS